MKRIKSINEFNRTIGFRYSKPTNKFRAISHIQGELSKDSLVKLLNYLDIPYENISIEESTGEVETEEGLEEYDVIVQFDFSVYSEAEIEKIIEEIRNGLIREFECMPLNFFIKELPRLK